MASPIHSAAARITQSEVAPTRTTFPTEQLRFSFALLGSRRDERPPDLQRRQRRNVNNFNETFIGLNSRTLPGNRSTPARCQRTSWRTTSEST